MNICVQDELVDQKANNAACYVEAVNDEAKAKASVILALCTKAKLNYQEYKGLEDEELEAPADFEGLPVYKEENKERATLEVEKLEKEFNEAFSKISLSKGKMVAGEGSHGGSTA